MSLIDDLRSALGSAYSIERELGGGGMSHVFLAEETALDRKVAVKVLLPELAAGVSAERFQREVKLAARLQHPNIVSVITAGSAAGLPYYTMPFVDGLSLRARLQRHAEIPIAEAIAILKDIARALAYAHDRGVVHRDIKPENVLLADETAVVTDFGIAKALHAARTDAPGGTLTEAGTSLGTPAYMAPEQISADPSVDHRADIYSFGCVAYEVLTGGAPFVHRTPQQLYAAHITEKPASVSDRRADCPDDIATIVMKCLEKDPGNRPESARQILRSLETHDPRGQSRGQQNRTQLVIAAIAGIAIFSGIAGYAAYRSKGADIHSLAVLPFENVGGDTTNAYFAEGMSDEITTELARVPGLALASRNSVAKYRGADPRQVGEALDVGGVIGGTVRRAGDRLRLTAQLTDASSGKIVWADTYEQKVQDLFAVQDSVTKSIVTALKLKLGDSQLPVVNATNVQGTGDLEAYDQYLRGKYFLARRGQSLYKALKLFEEATRRDPKFARAYAGYAMAAAVLPQYTDTPVDSILPLGLAAGHRAIALDPSLADAHLGIAFMLSFGYKWNEAADHLRRAIKLEPNNATAHQWYGDLLWTIGRGSEGIVEIRKAVTLDPASAVSHADLALAIAHSGDLKGGLTETRKAFEIDSTFPYNYLNVAAIRYMQGMYDSVVAIRTDLSQPYVSILRMMSYQKLGDARNAQILKDAILREIRKPNGDNDGSRHAMFFAAAGKADSTLFYIHRAIRERGVLVYHAGIPCFFMFRFLWKDPRWDAALSELNAERCTLQ